MIDPVKMLNDVPGALHVTVIDADGAAHDGVLTYASETRGAGEYGFPALDRDTVFVAAPFTAPRGRISIVRGTTATVRRIESIQDNALFYGIGLGEALHD